MQLTGTDLCLFLFGYDTMGSINEETYYLFCYRRIGMTNILYSIILLY